MVHSTTGQFFRTFYACFLLFLIPVTFSISCNGIDSSSNDACNGNGHCIAEDVCICHRGYEKGDYCEGILPLKRPTLDLYGLGENNVAQLQGNDTSLVSEWKKLKTSQLNSDKIIVFSHSGWLSSHFYTDQPGLYGWGADDRTGVDADGNLPDPSLVEGDMASKTIAYMCSADHTLIVTKSNDLIGFGRNTYSQIDSSAEPRPTPVLMDKGAIGTKDIVGVSCGTYVSLFLTSDGAVYSQGENSGDDFYLGISSLGSGSVQQTPARISNMNSKMVRLLTSGDRHSHIVTTDNEVYGWGYGFYLGTGSSDSEKTAVLIDDTNFNDASIKDICDGLNHGLLLTHSGEVYGWGFSPEGSLGTGGFSALSPEQALGSIDGKVVEEIHCAKTVSIAVTEDGLVHQWGRKVLGGTSNTPVLLDLTFNGISILDSQYISGVRAGQSHLLLEAYDFPTCYGITEGNDDICSGSGACRGDNVCVCDTGYGGEECEYAICSGILGNETDTVCSGVGDCVGPDTCNCQEGYTGTDCEITICYGVLSNDTGVCSGKGECVDPDQCECVEGYFGDQCEIIECFGEFTNDTQNVCSGNGECVSYDSCDCSSGYHGDECRIVECYDILSNSSDICSGHGECKKPDQCSCDEKYAGDQCELVECFNFLSNDTSNVCSGVGQCVSPDICDCSTGYYGEQCDIIECFDTWSNSTESCSGNGQCLSPDNCQCADGYFAGDCSVVECFNQFSNETDNVCSGQGTCIEPDQCDCNSGYTGTECELFICFDQLSNETSNVCSGRGTCEGPDSCNCEGGYGGPECEYQYCSGILSNETEVCSSRGTCVEFNTCSCNDGYSGDICELFICNNLLSNDSSVCSSRGNCTAPEQCTCDEGYSGTHCEINICFDVLGNESTVCSGRGNCSSPDVCDCRSEYYGEDCSVSVCYGIFSNMSTVCSSSGSCIDTDNCQCPFGYIGEECSNFYCFDILSNNTDVCSSHGNCTTYNECDCEEGWTGSNCQTAICFNVNSTETDVCNGRGSCVGPDTCECLERFNGTACEVCSSDYFGDSCETPICFDSVSNNVSQCSAHGDCVDVDNCDCSFGYITEDCSETTWCNSVQSTEEGNVCSGRGTCTSFDNCDCESGASGDDCTEFSCFGVGKEDVEVCSGHGLCSGPDECECFSGYGGDSCDEVMCFGVLASDSAVCSYSGSCDDVNQCTCSDSAQGDNCEFFSCYGVNNLNPESCSGHGSCQGEDNCNCDDGFVGDQCDTPVCNGTKATDSSVCNSNGACESSSDGPVCTCEAGYTGTFCESLICSGDASDRCLQHGSCAGVGSSCTCDSDATNGFWTGDECDTCSPNYYGDSCTQFCSSTSCSGVCNPLNGNCVVAYTTNVTLNSEQNTLFGTYSYRSRSTQISGTTADNQVVSCSDILDQDSLEAVGGEYAVCFWPSKDSNDIHIILGLNPSVKHGDTLTWKLDSNGNTEDATVIGSSENKPNAILLAPSSVGQCDDIFLDASHSTSTDRREMTFTWEVVNGGNLAAIQNFLSQSSDSTITISSNLLSGTSYVFGVHAISSLGVQSDQSLVYISRSNSVGPIVSLESPREITVHYLEPITIRASVSDTDCYQVSSDTQYSWIQRRGASLTGFSSLTTDSPQLVIPSGTFPARNATYEFELRVSDASAPLSSRVRVLVSTFQRELVPIIKGGSKRVVSSSFSLDASLSFDPEYLDETERFSWQCINPINYEVCAGQTSSITSQPVVQLSALSSGDYMFILRYTKGSRSSTTSATVTVASSSVPQVNVVAERNLIGWTPSKILRLFGQVQSSQSFSTTWSSTTVDNLSSISVDGITNRDLTLNKNSILPGSTNTFTLNAESTSGEGSASIDISAPLPVFPGQVSVSPTTGFAFITEFTFSCSNWQSTSLKYVFTFIHPIMNVEIPLGSLDHKPSITRKIPVHGNADSSYNIAILIRVFDPMTNSSAQIPSQITVQPRNDGAQVDQEVNIVQDDVIPSIDEALGVRRYDNALHQIILASESMNGDTTTTSTSCLRDCSDNGSCQNSTLSCKCSGSFVGDDCRLDESQLDTRREIRETLANKLSQIPSSEFDDEYFATQKIIAVESLSRRTSEMTSSVVSSLSTICQSLTSRYASYIQERSLLNLFSSALSNLIEGLKSENVDEISTFTAIYTSGMVLSRRFVGLAKLSQNTTSSQVERAILFSWIASPPSTLPGVDFSTENGLDAYFRLSLDSNFAFSSLGQLSTKDSDIAMRTTYWSFDPFENQTTLQDGQSVIGSVLSIDFDFFPNLAFRSIFEELDVSDLEEPIVFTIPANLSFIRESGVSSSVSCVFWNFTSSSWDGSGCELVSHTETEATCKCTHATDFSLLLSSSAVDGPVINYAILIGVLGAAIALLACCVCLCVLVCCIMCCACCLLSRNSRQKKRKRIIGKNIEVTGEEITSGYIQRGKKYKQSHQNIKFDDTESDLTSTISTLSVDGSEASVDASKYVDMDFVQEYEGHFESSSNLGSSNDGPATSFVSSVKESTLPHTTSSLSHSQNIVTPSRLSHLNDTSIQHHEINLEDSDDEDESGYDLVPSAQDTSNEI